jgi:hypothetical protein
MTSRNERVLKLYGFLDRAAARLPDFFLPKAKGVLLAEADLLRAVELPLWLDYPLGWSMLDTNWGRSHDRKLEVAKLGEYWFVGRRTGWDAEVSETVVESFGQVPVCSRAVRDAMLIAEHCHPEVRLPIGAHWLKFD